MKKKVTIARALKEKNRLAGKLSATRRLIGEENSKEKKIPRGIDVKATYVEAEMLMQQMIAIKTAIASANHPIVGTIIELDEVKSELAWLQGLDTREGKFTVGRAGTQPYIDEFDAVINKGEVLAAIDALQKRADALQDTLDEFNATTRIEIEMDA
ncbi:MAG: hypothetical protein J6334_11675 [Kiritimatiellae bacterium]|nr:hypothetical protein [Kiritimatiellia bacterium]